MAIPSGFVLEAKPTTFGETPIKPINLPPGFELETRPKTELDLPSGFILDKPVPSDIGKVRRTPTSKALMEKPTGLLSRLGKQFYNVAIATPAHELGKADMDAAGVRAIELTKQWEKEQGTRLSDDLFDEQIKDWASQLREPSRARESDYLKKERQYAAEKPDVNPFAAYVSEAQSLSEKAIDIIAGVVGFAAQLAVLRKAFPMAKPAVIWETQNLATGGNPGAGVAMYGAFTVPGKIIKGTSLVARGHILAAESINLAALSAIEQKIDTGEIDYIQVGIAAGIPIALRTPKAIKVLIRKRSPEVMRAIAVAHPEILERLPGQRALIRKAKLPPAPAPTLETTNKVVLSWAKKTELVGKAGRKKTLFNAFPEIKQRYYQKYKLEIKAGSSPKKARVKAYKEAMKIIPISKIYPLTLTKAQNALYLKEIEKVYPSKFLDKRLGAVKTILKMQTGELTTNYEIGLLEPVMGRTNVEKLFGILHPKKPYDVYDAPEFIRDGLKAIRFGFDPQAARGLSKTSWRHPVSYAKTVGVNIAGILSKKRSDKIAANIESSKTYKLGKDEYGVRFLSMTPYASVEAGTKLQQYGNFADLLLRSDDEVIKGIGKWLRASERGANLGMNYGINKLVKKGEKDLIRYLTRMAKAGKLVTPTEIEEWREQRGKIINAFSKRVIAEHPKMKEIQKAANWIIFSPAYAISGPTADVMSLIRIGTGKGFANRTYGLQMMLSQIAGLTAVSGITSYVGYKKYMNDPTKAPSIDSSSNPLNPLFGKIRQENNVYDLAFGDAGTYRLLARVGLSAHMFAKEKLTGKQITAYPGWAGGKKAVPAGESFHRYLNSKRTLWLGITNQILTGKDWLGRPTDLKGTVIDNLPFEFLAAFVEAGEADGLWEEMENGMDLDIAKKSLWNLPTSIAALGGVGTMSYPVHAATIRNRFQNEIAQQKHEKDWDKLSISEQKGLEGDYREKFERFAEQIRKERVEVPFSSERMQKEKTEANRRVSKMLSEENRILVKGIDLDISRIPKKFYLNDERYNKYQKLVAQYLDERLSEIDITDIEDKWRVKRLQAVIRGAKSRALVTLREEMEEAGR